MFLGFIVVGVAAVAVLRWGRRTGALTLVALGVGGALLSEVLAGRDGLSDFVVSALIGLPVLVASMIRRDRAGVGVEHDRCSFMVSCHAGAKSHFASRN